MAYIISSGDIGSGIISENDTMNILNGGIQTVLDLYAEQCQIIYLDFDGELTKYRNADLDLEINNVQVEDSRLTPDRIAGIIASLNTNFSVYNVIFTSERPKDAAYSTIFVGKTSAFDQYGQFAGLAETVDIDNQIKDDNAFVLLDAASSDSDIVSTIAHEAEHLLGTLEHGGDGLKRYMITSEELDEYRSTYLNQTFSGEITRSTLQMYHYGPKALIRIFSYEYSYDKASGVTISDGGILVVSVGCSADKTTVNESGMLTVVEGVANETVINHGGTMFLKWGQGNDTTINSGGRMEISAATANSVTVNPCGSMFVCSSATVNSVTVNPCGSMFVSNGANAFNIKENGGCVWGTSNAQLSFVPNTFGGLTLTDGMIATVHSGTTATNVSLDPGGRLAVYEGGTVIGISLYANGGTLEVNSGGTANHTILHEGVHFSVAGGAVANNTVVNPGAYFYPAYTGTYGIVENGGYVDCRYSSDYSFAPNTITGLELLNASATVHSGTTANSTVISSGGLLELYTGGVADHTVINQSGRLTLFSATVNNTLIQSGGGLLVGSNCVANKTTVRSGGLLQVYYGGIANSATVDFGGFMQISGGAATATEIIENGGYVNIKYASNVSFAPHAITGLVLSSGCSATVHSGTTANGTVISSGGLLELYTGGIADNTVLNENGSLFIYSAVINSATLNHGYLSASIGCTVNNTTINFGGSLVLGNYYGGGGGTANSTTVNSGGCLTVFYSGGANSTTVNPGGSMVLYSGASAADIIENGGYVNVWYAADLTFASNTFTGVTLSGLSATVHSNTTAENTVIGSGGSLFVFSGGTATGTSVNSDGGLQVFGGTIKDALISNGGSLILSSGGKATGQMTFYKGAVVSAASGAIIDFNIAENATGFTARVNDLSIVSGRDKADYTITVSDKQAEGEYLLAEGASDFNKTISVVGTSGEVLGTLAIGNAVKINGMDYVLNLKDDVLSVRIGDWEPAEINYEFTDIGQTVYYDGEKPNDCELEGTLMAIPFTADITISFDKTLGFGEYEFTTSVAEVPGSVNNCKIQIADAEGIPDLNGEYNKWSVAYISHDACCYGTKIGETDTTVTYQFTNVNDYLLIDSIPDDSLDIGVACGTLDDETVVIRSNNAKVSYSKKKNCDTNKRAAIEQMSGNGLLLTGEEYSFVICRVVDGYDKNGKPYYKTIKDSNLYQYAATYTIGTKAYHSLEVTESNSNIVFTLKPEQRTDADIVIYVDSESLNAKILVGKDQSQAPVSGKIDKHTFAPWDYGHCWVATASNMLAAAGYLSVSAEECFEILNKRYFIKDGNKSIGSRPERVFKDFLIKGGASQYSFLFLEKETPFLNPSRIFSRNSIGLGLQNIESCKGKIVGAICFESSTDNTHVITCYSVSLNDDKTRGTIIYADSDDIFEKNGNSTEGLPVATVYQSGGEWYVELPYYGQTYHIVSIYSLISNNSDNELGKSELLDYKLVADIDTVYSLVFSGISSSDDGAVTVSEFITDSIVMNEGNLTIAAGAEAEEMVVHGGGTVNFNSGSIAKGKIRTFGGVLAVESGVDVSEAEFDFAVSYMDGGNNTVLLNSLNNVSGSKLTITIVNGQSAGKYVLAGGAANFNGTLSVVGEYNCLQKIGEGFEDGFIGELGLDNALYIEGKNYFLTLEEDDLVLMISGGGENPLGFTGDFNGDGADMLACQKDGTVTIFMNGEPWGLGVTLDEGWDAAGVGDFNGDKMDDILRVNTEGYVVSEISNGNGTFTPQVLNLKSAGWDILGAGDFDGNGSDDVLIANPTGASETVGLLGYWESGVTWTLINGYSAEWECVATGDFNGDGKCDMLWRNSFVGDGGLTYNAYCTWIVEPPAGQSDWRMVSVANPTEWNFLCSGDFNADGANDIAMINGEGVVGIWGVNDGYLNSWSILSAVDTSAWKLAGVGDFNGDHTDDIAWCNTDTGLAGYWQINDKQLTAWANIAMIG